MAARPGEGLDSLHSLQAGATHVCNETNPGRPTLRARAFCKRVAHPHEPDAPARDPAFLAGASGWCGCATRTQDALKTGRPMVATPNPRPDRLSLPEIV